ncbi:MAG: tol-pal system YbgF family protein, partial [bacterium]
GFLKQPEKKVAAYSRAATEYAVSIYADEATFRLAQAYEEAGKIEDAIGTYEKLLQDFPMSIYLEETRQRIRTLRDGAAVQ